jgi:pyrroline-5-carboxylate reductase
MIVNKKIGFIGGGAMGEALIAGLLRRELFTPENILVSDVNTEQLKYLYAKYGVNIKETNDAVIESADILLFAVKPQVMGLVLGSVLEPVRQSQLIISIVAGVTLEYLSNYFPKGTPVVRVMPNTPCLVGQGISAIAIGASVGKDEQATAEGILASVGKVLVMSESMLDAVTALSGSGPAYAYLILESLIDAGVRVGLPRDISKELVLQTMSGSIAMVRETEKHPAQLKDMVTSPGGTTVAALEVLEKSGLRGTLIEAVRAAWERSKELNAPPKG